VLSFWLLCRASAGADRVTVGFGFESRREVDKVRDRRSERGGANARWTLDDISMLMRIRVSYGVGKGYTDV
jgi:hypothetical protein